MSTTVGVYFQHPNANPNKIITLKDGEFPLLGTIDQVGQALIVPHPEIPYAITLLGTKETAATIQITKATGDIVTTADIPFNRPMIGVMGLQVPGLPGAPTVEYQQAILYVHQ